MRVDAAAHPRLIRVAEGGDIIDERTSSGDILYACMLGGDDGCTLSRRCPRIDADASTTRPRRSRLHDGPRAVCRPTVIDGSSW